MTELTPPRRPNRDEEQVQRSRLKALLAVIVVTLMAVVVALGLVTDSEQSKSGLRLAEWWWAVAGAVAVFFGIIVAVDTLTPKRKLSTMSALFFGGFAGLLVTFLLGMVIDYFVSTSAITNAGWVSPPQIFMFKVILGLGLCYLGATTVLQTQDDFRLVIPYVEFAKQLRGAKPLILDTSALIDGRILDISEVGLVQTPLVIPGFVIGELQTLGDSSDKLKRARGRRGLEVVAKLQRSPRLDVTLDETSIAGKEVDAMIVELARMIPGTIVTTDMGLNRVASIQGVTVMNINDLANALKPNVIPGEPLGLNLMKRGEQPGQAVGYLEDGTMVVAENGEPWIGQDVTLIVKSTMQTSAGRLIFGRIEEDGGDDGGAPMDTGDIDHGSEAGGPFGPGGMGGTGGPRQRPRTHRNPRRA